MHSSLRSMRSRFGFNIGIQGNDIELIDPPKSNGHFNDNSHFKLHNMLARKNQHLCVFLLATVWTLIGTFYIMASVIVQQADQSSLHRSSSFDKLPVDDTIAVIRTQEEDIDDAQIFDNGDTQNDDNEDTQNGKHVEDEDNPDEASRKNDDEDETVSDQDEIVEEVEESIGNLEPPKNADDDDDNNDDDENSEGPDHHEYRDMQVDEFCGAFVKHCEKKDLQLNPSDDEESFESLVKTLNSRTKKGRFILSHMDKKKRKASWLSFFHEITQYALYNPESQAVPQLLNDLATKRLHSVVNFDKGTQIKLLLTFKDGAKAVMKPMRFPREQETLPDHFYFNDFERHIAEIAAFHLDRVLGFYRVPPTVGRVFSIEKDFNGFINTTLEEKTYISPAGNTCFYSDCDMYCDSNHPICGTPDQVEASLQIFLPGKDKAEHEDEMHPWARSYSTTMLSPWEHNDKYCETVKAEDQLYRKGRRLLDLMDVAVFDFFMGNMDRHDIDVFLRFGAPNTAPILLDNGRGFGQSKKDIVSILAPIAQCCQIRLSTLAKIVKLYLGPENLSKLMRTSLEKDPLKSVLTEKHLVALDRRVVIILNVVRQCVEKTGDFDRVVIDDGH